MHFVALMLQYQPDPDQIRHFFLALIPILIFIIAISLAIVIVPFWFILKKAGFSPWLSLLYIVPFGNLFLYYFLAFADWKVVPAPQGAWPPYMPYPPQVYPPPPFPPQTPTQSQAPPQTPTQG
jgi:flagellar basal body-associated protein FliL